MSRTAASRGSRRDDVARARRWVPFLRGLGVDEETVVVGHSSGAAAAMRLCERERVKACGARVMTADQIDGVEPIHEVRISVVNDLELDLVSSRWRRVDCVEVMIQQWRVDGVDAMSCLLDAVEAAVRESARVCSRHAIAATAPRVFRSRAGLGLRIRG